MQRDPQWGKTQGMTGTWVQTKGGKGGSESDPETAVDAGMRREEQRRAAKSGGCRVREMSRWEALLTGRGGGEMV